MISPLTIAPAVDVVTMAPREDTSRIADVWRSAHRWPSLCGAWLRHRPVYRYVLQLLAMALVYFVAGQLSFWVSQQNLVVTIVIFTAEGFSLGALLLFGYRLWPGVFLGQLALALYVGTPLAAATAIAAINSLEAALGVWLFRRLGLDKDLATLRDVIGLMLLISLVLQPFSALFGNLALVFSSVIAWQQLPMSLFSWWFGNSMGQLLITPMLLLLWSHRRETRLTKLLLLAVLFAALTWLLQTVVAIHNVSLLISISGMAVVLLAIYQGIHYASVATAVVSLVSVLAIKMGSSALAYQNTVDHIIDLNFFILSHILLVLVIGTLFREKEAALQRCAAGANRDSLTGLPNRNMLQESIARAIHLADRYGERSAICFIDLDGFKAVNDRLGHHAGDEVLKTVVFRINQVVREEDLLIRLGGDEFILIINRLPAEDVLDILLTRVMETVCQPIETSAGEARVSLSIGVAMVRDCSVTAPELIARADKAMYRAKQQGKNCFVLLQV